MSIKVKVYNQKAEAVGEMNLSDKIFGVKASEHLVHQAMVTQMSNERQVLAHTKGRSEVRGGGRKPWRQKGTGRARAGTIRSPLWKGGGVTFGPLKTRNFKKDINKKMKQKALLMVLSDKVGSDVLYILDKLTTTEFKTKPMDAMISRIEGLKKPASSKTTKNKPAKEKPAKRSVLVINDKKDDKTKFSFRNLSGVKIINLDNINILDLLKFRDLIVTKEVIKKLEEQYKK